MHISLLPVHVEVIKLNRKSEAGSTDMISHQLVMRQISTRKVVGSGRTRISKLYDINL